MADELVSQLGSFSPSVATDCIRKMRVARRGALLVTSGQADVRLVVSDGIALEAAGFQLVGSDENDIIRAFLCSLFWEEPSYFLEPGGRPNMGAQAIRVTCDAFSVLNQMDKGIQELRDLTERVPGMDTLVSVHGDPPPDDVDTPSANLFRVLARSPKGGHLGTAADEAGLDTLDAAWGVFDLLEVGQAEVRKPPASLAIRRIRYAEPLADEGLIPGVRYAHLARGFARSDPRRATRYCIESGVSFLDAGLPEQALQAYETCLNLDSDNIVALEGLVRSLDGMKRPADAAKIREQLIPRYLRWNMPLRARNHLEALPRPTAEQREQVLNTMLLLKDFTGAADYVQRHFTSLDANQRLALARSFADYGARGDDLDRMIEQAGVHSMRPVRRILNVVAALCVVGLALIGVEIWLRVEYRRAAKATKADLVAGRIDPLLTHWEKLDEITAKVPFGSPSVLGAVQPLRAELECIQLDDALMSDPAQRDVLAWDAPGKDSREAEKALARLIKGAQSEPLRQLIEARQAEVKAYREEVATAAKDFREILNRDGMLEEAQRLLREHANAADLFRDLEVSLVINVIPTDTTLEWGLRDGRRRPRNSMRAGTWLVKLPVELGSYGTVHVSALKGFVAQKHVVRLSELKSPELSFELFQITKGETREEKPDPDQTLVGLVISDRLRNEKNLTKAAANLGGRVTVRDSQAALQPLTADLAPQHRLTVKVVSNARFVGKTVYVERIYLWLDHIGSKKSAGPWELRFQRDGGANFGLPRRHREVRGLVIEDIGKCAKFDLVLEALRAAIVQLKKELEQ